MLHHDYYLHRVEEKYFRDLSDLRKNKRREGKKMFLGYLIRQSSCSSKTLSSYILCYIQWAPAMVRRIKKILWTLNMPWVLSLLTNHELVVQWCRNRGGQGGHWPPPIFGRPVNSIPTMGGRFCPPFTGGTPNVFHLPAALLYIFF